MSTQNRFAIVGFVSPGLFWLATSVAQGQIPPRPQGLPSIPAPASSSTYSVLLMSNGTVVSGEITDDPAGGVYRLKTRGGQVPYPKSSVKRAGHSIEELYKYQVMALPPGDPDERMKLVRWCLTEHLPEQARKQLADVLKLCPDDAQALRMAQNLDAHSENANRDLDVRQTSGEMPGDDAPATLDPGVVKNLRKKFGNALPEIFDLPPAVAVTRASEFAQYVQPVLQQNCASCHNEKYTGDFQLVVARGRRDQQNPDIARANLDAVLRLVNPDDPSRSELLSAGLVPHGAKSNAIFRGANDPPYKILATWVRRVRPAAPASASAGKNRTAMNEGVTQAGYIPPEATDGFGTDRTGRAGSNSAATGFSSDKPTPYTPPGASKVVNEYTESADFSRGAAKDFPVPTWVDGKQFDYTPPKTKSGRRPAGSAPLPPLPGTKPALKQAETQDVDPNPDGPAVTPTTATQVGPGAVSVDLNEDMNNLPGMNQPKYPTSLRPKAKVEPTDDEDPAKPAPLAPTAAGATPVKKKPKVDPALLEKMIKARNSSTP